MTILQLATGGWSHPHKEQCVAIDRTIETIWSYTLKDLVMYTENEKIWWSLLKLSRRNGMERSTIVPFRVLVTTDLVMYIET